MNNQRTPFHKRRLVRGSAAAVGIPLIAIGWWLFSPLFLNRTVVEDFPRAAAALIPADMTAEEVEAVMLESETDDAPVTEPMPDESSDSAESAAGATGQPLVLASGPVVGADSLHQGSGTATIYQLEDGSRLLRLEDFDVTNGPNLHVLLSPVADPQSSDEVTAAGYIDLGALKGNRGDQNYEIPADYDLPEGEYSVVIYCVPFHVVFASATLSPA